MVRHRLAVSLLAIVMPIAGPAFAQAGPAAAVVCNAAGNVEDAACRDQLKGLFARQGDRLTLALADGRSKTYAGDGAACEGDNTSKCLIFRVLGYFPHSQSYLIERARYACGAYLLVSRRTGSEIVMPASPVLSPGGRYLLSAGRGDACDHKYDITIWSLQTDPPTREFSHEAGASDNWTVEAWDNDDRVRMKASVRGPAAYDQGADLVRDNGGWRLVLGRRTEPR